MTNPDQVDKQYRFAAIHKADDGNYVVYVYAVLRPLSAEIVPPEDVDRMLKVFQVDEVMLDERKGK